MAIKPVRFGESGAKVTALHKDLLYLIHYQGSVTDGMRAANEAYLAHDLIPNRFGSATAGIVGIYQAQLVSRVKAKTKNNPDPVPDKFGGIPMLRSDTGNGAVDVLTAEALNCLSVKRASKEAIRRRSACKGKSRREDSKNIDYPRAGHR